MTSSENPIKYLCLLMLALSLILFGMCIDANAQKYERSGTEFVQRSTTQKVIKTKYTWVDSNGNKYPIYLTAKSCYIIKVPKKTGKEYKQYLSKEIFKEIKKELKNTQR